MQFIISLIALGAALPAVLAKTDIAGCTSSLSGNSYVFWVPGTGEICEFLDCGGGRAPPKYNVPGCAAYTGTLPYVPNYLPGYGPNGQVPPATTPEAVVSTAAPAITSTLDASSVEASTVVELPSVTPTGHGSTLITAAPTLPHSTVATPVSSTPAPTFTGAASNVGRNFAGMVLGAAAAVAML